MAWFLNPFNTEFRGSLLVGDRQYLPNFKCPPHKGRSEDYVEGFVNGPWDLSGNDADGNATANLKIAVESRSPGIRLAQWITVTVDITAEATDTSAVTADEIIAALNGDEIFSSRFTCRKANNRVGISLAKSHSYTRFFIIPGTADTVLGFNKKAGVAELPNIFKRDKVSLQMTSEEQEYFKEFENTLWLLDPQASGGSSTVDNTYINEAVNGNRPLNYDASVTQEDYQLLGTSVPFFSFKKQTVDGSNRITEIIEYPCGAKPGQMVKKTMYTYTAANTQPSEIFELPYILQSADLITP